jgi:hypothetical protein
MWYRKKTDPETKYFVYMTGISAYQSVAEYVNRDDLPAIQELFGVSSNAMEQIFEPGHTDCEVCGRVGLNKTKCFACDFGRKVYE